MRIKSYFAPSVQSAITLARQEFGEDVTLVTSHVASLDARHLGEYEVVFAVEQPLPVEPNPPEAVPVPDTPFSGLLLQALATPPSPSEDLPGKLDQVRSSLIALGLAPPMVTALMTIIGSCAGGSVAEPIRKDEPTSAREFVSQNALEASEVLENPSVSGLAEAGFVSLNQPLPGDGKPTDATLRKAASVQPVPKRLLSPAELSFALSVSEISEHDLALYSSDASPNELAQGHPLTPSIQADTPSQVAGFAQPLRS